MSITIDGATNEITFNGSVTTGTGGIVRTTSPALVTPKATTTIGVGNATPAASGAGITFPATQSASSDANTLDDYEEGTWTPTFTPDAGSFTSITYASNRNGSYTKIGNQVFVSGYIRTDAITVGTASGLIYVSGLPFATSANLWRDTGSIGYADAFNVNHPCTVKTVPSTDRLAFTYITTANGAHSTLQVSDLATGVSSNFIFFSAAYTV